MKIALFLAAFIMWASTSLANVNKETQLVDISIDPGIDEVLESQPINIFSSKDVEAIRSALSVLATGQETVVTLGGYIQGTATCRVNTMAELPGYRCEFSVTQNKQLVEFTIYDSDFALIESELAAKTSGSVLLKLKTVNMVLCDNTNLAGVSGYYCQLP